MKIKRNSELRNLNPSNPLNNEITKEKQKCYYVNLDGCLAYYDNWGNVDDIGEPINEMKKWILYWLKKGIKIKIFTARANQPELIPPIRKWLLFNGFPPLEITNIKGIDCNMIFDNNARQVVNNTGQIIDCTNQFNKEERDEYLEKTK